MDFLAPAFYQRPTLTVARELLGKIFIRRIGALVLSGRIVEVEAYHEKGDEASHTFIGRRARNDVMFRAGGHLYVYFTYGMHYCMNTVTEQENVGAGILIRAIEPLEGIDIMRRNRGGSRPDRELTNGPAKICQAFAVGREENGLPLDGKRVGILDAPCLSDEEILVTGRIGITRSRELPWRFLSASSTWTSRGNPWHADGKQTPTP
jgi:DNA-3-methyladenine glycosylase